MIINLHNTKKFWLFNSTIFLLLSAFNAFEGSLLIYVLSAILTLIFLFRLKESFSAKRMNEIIFRPRANSIIGINDPVEKIDQSEAYRQIYFAFGQNIYEQYVVMFRNYALAIFMLGVITNWPMISISLWLISMTFNQTNRHGYPAFALVLGSSQSAFGKELALSIGKAIRPLNCISFLEFFTGNEIEEAAEYFSGIRWGSEVMPWEAAVKANIVTCGIIIVDATKSTKHVEAELTYISQEELWYKTLIFGPPEADTEIGEIVETGEKFGACTFNDVNSVSIFMEKLRSIPEVPSPTKSISDLRDRNCNRS